MFEDLEIATTYAGYSIECPHCADYEHQESVFDSRALDEVGFYCHNCGTAWYFEEDGETCIAEDDEEPEVKNAGS